MRFGVVKSLLVVLLLLCIFDSQDALFGLKTPIFIIIILLSLIYGLYNHKKISGNLMVFTIIFSFAIPLLSIIIGLIRDGLNPVNLEGLIYWKAFLFLLIIFVLNIFNYDLLNPLIRILTILSIVTIIFYILAFSSEYFFFKLYDFGNYYGILSMGYRNFGDVKYPYIYFHTTPLLVISVAYYSYQIFGLKGRNIAVILSLVLSILSMIFSGTRNNIFMSFVTCLVVWIYYSNNRRRIAILIGFIFIFLMSLPILIPSFRGMFSTTENSNQIKLGYLSSYVKEFKDIKTLIFGQGLGSFFFESGINKTISNTELTYLEIFRRFGLFLGGLLIGLMLYPLLAIRKHNSEYMWLFIAYGCYLFMINFNPFFFSSTGMIILSIVLYKMYQLEFENK